MSARRRIRLLPDTITGWFVVVLAAVLLVSHLAVLGLYARNREAALEAAGLRQAADRMAAAVETVAAAPPEARRGVARAMGSHGFRVVLSPAPVVEPGIGPLVRIMEGLLRERLPDAVELSVGRLRDDLPPPSDMPPGMGRMHARMTAPGALPHVAAGMRLSDGMWLTGVVVLDRPERLWQPQFLVLVTAVTLVVGAIAYWGLRRAVRPLRTLEAAAVRLGVDVRTEPLPETGPREVRRAAAAFNEMQRRLTRYVEDRTRMLAAISHDLRTPITRLRLRAELMDDETDRDKMLADLEDMERMIAATLAFARQDAQAEPPAAVDLAALLRDAAEGRPVTVEAPDALVLQARPTGLKRVFANLLDNAEKYGGSASVLVTRDAGAAVVTVDDRGPGIPPAEREKVFAPFYRIEASRSRETGGTGLGLSVARTIVHAHGGTITLSDAPGGGLRVTVTLPL
ncbi:ATP-binding protein [Caenispirillum bisanense]|uniref:histidine kinase n=1 Tax=Caenispirillum bisanense TaxID=414052 RepID=A0A286GEA3_9PROT|nr:ATP-binding protein [Caenispirillum bisanense]SOD93830.1 Signal transduction histidine kinase [Caenispirillum bisanense]